MLLAYRFILGFFKNLKKVDSIIQIFLRRKSDLKKAVRYVSKLQIQKECLFNHIPKRYFYTEKVQLPKYISNFSINFSNGHGVNISNKRASI